MEASVSDDQLKDLVKRALLEVLDEHRELLREALGEALEDIALTRAIDEGAASEQVSREIVFQILDSGD